MKLKANLKYADGRQSEYCRYSLVRNHVPFMQHCVMPKKVTATATKCRYMCMCVCLMWPWIIAKWKFNLMEVGNNKPHIIHTNPKEFSNNLTWIELVYHIISFKRICTLHWILYTIIYILNFPIIHKTSTFTLLKSVF